MKGSTSKDCTSKWNPRKWNDKSIAYQMVTRKIREQLFHERFVQNQNMTILSFHKHNLTNYSYHGWEIMLTICHIFKPGQHFGRVGKVAIATL